MLFVGRKLAGGCVVWGGRMAGVCEEGCGVCMGNAGACVWQSWPVADGGPRQCVVLASVRIACGQASGRASGGAGLAP